MKLPTSIAFVAPWVAVAVIAFFSPATAVLVGVLAMYANIAVSDNLSTYDKPILTRQEMIAAIIAGGMSADNTWDDTPEYKWANAAVRRADWLITRLDAGVELEVK